MDPRVDYVLRKLAWMRDERIWPDGLRYLWTDAFGILVLVSLYEALGDPRHLDDAERVVAEVDRVLGRRRGIRIGEAPDRDGQYFHYLAMWMFALQRLGRHRARHRAAAVALVREIHPHFVVPAVGVFWKMREDLTAPYPGYGLGALDPFQGYVVYRLLDDVALAPEIADMRRLAADTYPKLHVTQDLGLGMLLWASHFAPGEPWATTLRTRALATLEGMWIDPPGYFCREPALRDVRFAFTNYGVSIGLQAVGAHPERVRRLNAYFETYRSHDEYDRNAITHVMACASWLPAVLIDQHEGEPRRWHDRQRARDSSGA